MWHKKFSISSLPTARGSLVTHHEQSDKASNDAQEVRRSVPPKEVVWKFRGWFLGGEGHEGGSSVGREFPRGKSVRHVLLAWLCWLT